MPRALAGPLVLLPLLLACGGEPPDDDEWSRARRAFDAFDRQHSSVHAGGRVPLHYLDWRADPRDVVPLLYLHGTYSTAHEFAPFADALVDAGYAPVAVDWYGHGRTPLPSDDVTLDALVEDLCGLLDALGIERTVLVGHSRGGMIATALYAHAPERVLGLVLVDGGSVSMERFFAGWSDEQLEAFLMGAVDPETRRFRVPSHASERELFDAVAGRLGRPADPVEMFWLLAQAHRRGDGRWVRTRRSTLRWLDQETFEGAWRGMRRPAESPPFLAACTRLDPRAVFAALDVPVLILDAVGDGLDWTPQNLALVADHPDLVERRAYDTGHVLFREEPARYVEDLIAFRARVAER